MLNFFKTHECGPLCHRLGLKVPPMSKLQADADVEIKRQCVVCLERPRYVRFAPCGHATCCEECAEKLMAPDMPRTCPLCRTRIATIRERGPWIALEATALSIS